MQRIYRFMCVVVLQLLSVRVKVLVCEQESVSITQLKNKWNKKEVEESKKEKWSRTEHVKNGRM